MRTADATVSLGVSLLVLWVAVAAWALYRRRWHPALLGTGLAATAFTLYAVVVDAVADPAPLASADGPVLAWFVAHRTAALDPIMIEVSRVGGTLGMAVLTSVGVVVLLARRRVRDALLVAVVAFGAGGLVGLTKNLYQRQRPPEVTRLTIEPTYALPSGHALSSFAVLGVLSLVLVLSVRRRSLQVGIVVLAAAGVAVIGTSRLYLGVHWFTDVLAGWLLGGAWFALVSAVLVGVSAGSQRRRLGSCA